jgi:thiol-disulfide isomerase/thioredoxin
MQQIDVILAHAHFCPHCTHFLPIFDKAEKEAKKHEFLKDYDVTFEKYDFDPNNADAEKHEIDFNNEHPEIINNVDGFPTVFVKINKTDSKDGNTYAVIPHAVDKTGIDDAVKDFLDNIANEVKTIKSGGKEKFVNVNKLVGGSNGLDAYLDYKMKYLAMKNLCGINV